MWAEKLNLDGVCRFSDFAALQDRITSTISAWSRPSAPESNSCKILERISVGARFRLSRKKAKRSAAQPRLRCLHPLPPLPHTVILHYDCITQSSLRMQERVAAGLLGRVSPWDPPMVITGPPGVGKTVLSSAVARRSDVRRHFRCVQLGRSMSKCCDGYLERL